jgi:hypothetical protein
VEGATRLQPHIDSVLETLRDGKWHTFSEISQKTRLHEFKIDIITDFLADYSFLEKNRRDKKAKLTRLFADFLKKTWKLRNVTLT